MPEIINSLFGRSRNDNSGEAVTAPTAVQTDSAQPDATDVVITDETGGTNAFEVKPTDTETAEPTDEATTDAEDETDADEATDAEGTDDESDIAAGADDEADDEIADDEAAVEDSDEAPSDEGLAEEDADDVTDEDSEPVVVESDDAPVAAETDADDVDDVDQTEPVVEAVVAPVVELATAETRPTAGNRGTITVGEGVVAKVANIVVSKIDGVHGLDDEGISVEVDDDIATIRVSLVLEYGHAIKALAEQIRVDVIEAVEQFLGLDVAFVDVHVSDIHPPA